MKSMLKTTAVLIMALAVLNSCSSSGGGGTSGGSTYTGARQWTYMVYMGADNNLSDGGLYNLNDMETVGSSAGVAIVVQAEFSPRYTTGITGLTSETGRVYVENDHNPNAPNLNAGTLIGNVDMADPATLTAFITWAKTNYPAQHYALVVWDHGAGWKVNKLASPLKGAVSDESAASAGALMSLPNLAKAVADSGVHFDIINFDACLMAMYEVAYEFKGLTDYMVFSEQTEPGTGDPYGPILAALSANPTMNARTLSTIIVDKYYEFYANNPRSEDTTKSAVDMAQLPALDTKILALASALKNDTSANTIAGAARTATQNYAYPANHDIYDFCSYVSVHSSPSSSAKAVCGDIMTMMPTVVIDSKATGTGVTASHGLAIYVPQASETSASDLTDYAKLKCNLVRAAAGTWGDYVNTLLGNNTLQTYGKGDFALYLYWTKPDGTACNADLDLYVIEPDGTGAYKDYSPYMGQTTPNGFFSQESTQSGKSEEFYVANAQVVQGTYTFLANYYANGSSCTSAQAHLLIQDAVVYGDTNWRELYAAKTMDLTNKYVSGCQNLGCFNTYSDWWVPGSTTRTTTTGTYQADSFFPINGRSNQLIFRYDRGSVLQGITQ